MYISVKTTLHPTSFSLVFFSFIGSFQINEHYLFHGTKEEAVPKIELNGLDFRFAGTRLLLGNGCYTAEKSTKADQYGGRKLQLY